MNAPQPRDPEILGTKLAEAIDTFDPFEALRLAGISQLETRDEEAGVAVEEVPAVGHAITNRLLPTPLRRRASSADIETAFVGVLGLLGPLPPFYTEIALRERKRRSHAFRGFFDVFLQRLVGLFVRAHEKYRLPSLVARHGSEGEQAVTNAIYALVGLGLPALRGRLSTPDSRLLPYAGLLARDVRSAAALEVILGDHFGLAIKIEPLRRRWLPIEPHEQTRLGGAFTLLGVDTVAGARTLDVTSTFRVVIGPVDYGTFQWLAPGSETLSRLVEMVRFYVDPGLDFDVQVILRKQDVPECQLGAVPPRLGWNGWLRNLPALKDGDQAVFDPGSPAAGASAS